MMVPSAVDVSPTHAWQRLSSPMVLNMVLIRPISGESIKRHITAMTDAGRITGIYMQKKVSQKVIKGQIEIAKIEYKVGE